MIRRHFFVLILAPFIKPAADFDKAKAVLAKFHKAYPRIQDTIDWLCASHIANIRKAMSADPQFIADPSPVHIEDLI